ncbi:hypothetical protein CHS0354_001855 [Potamilus streckersoni]|uniref:Uncharacterized protein n=1 Tax=Potamilus streckersoni TaxID=2493646 RepID=A0AAE0VRK7_9BIVA|nr:hypothetical protein CHS0354_001855 [Potamilus streckersoni]
MSGNGKSQGTPGSKSWKMNKAVFKMRKMFERNDKGVSNNNEVFRKQAQENIFRATLPLRSSQQ